MNEEPDTLEINMTIADIVDDHILVCDAEGKIIFSNKSLQAHLGYTATELKQKKFLDMVADISFNKAKSFIAAVGEVHSKTEDFLLNGKHGIVKLHLKFVRRDELIYIFGNEKYIEYEALKKKLDREIANAIKIHRRTLPDSLPKADSISFASLYIPAEELGGDLYDVFKVDNGLLDDFFEQYVCFVADVSGHGLDSAMLSIFVKDTIKSYFKLKHIPGQVLSPQEIMHFFVEQYMKEMFPDDYLVCIFLVVFDLKTKELTYCSAGFQIPPLLVSDKTGIMELDCGGLPVSTGLDIKFLQYENHSIQLSPGMTLLATSDGMPEQISGGEMYYARLRKLFSEIYNETPHNIIQGVEGDFKDFLKYHQINDDITLVVVQIGDTIE
ncbi:MAG: SpoIIE family protein phosphatase [Peptococcaceae bacterium]